MHHCLHFVFRQLHCTRVTIHKNLFLSYILYGMTWLLFRHLVPLEVAMESPVRPGKQRPLTYVNIASYQIFLFATTDKQVANRIAYRKYITLYTKSINNPSTRTIHVYYSKSFRFIQFAKRYTVIQVIQVIEKVFDTNDITSDINFMKSTYTRIIYIYSTNYNTT